MFSGKCFIIATHIYTRRILYMHLQTENPGNLANAAGEKDRSLNIFSHEMQLLLMLSLSSLIVSN